MVILFPILLSLDLIVIRMAYRDFTLEDIEMQFGIKNRNDALFAENTIKPQAPSAELLRDLAEARELPIRSEKAKSELIVVPILLELRKLTNKFFTIYSGDTLSADKELGLVGECDFLLAKDTGSFSINVPLLSVVEAKKSDIEAGIPQCSAQLIGARVFNEQRGQKLPALYGCVTTADDWKFLKLQDQIITVDKDTYYLRELDVILGIFHHIISFYRQELT